MDTSNNKTASGFYGFGLTLRSAQICGTNSLPGGSLVGINIALRCRSSDENMKALLLAKYDHLEVADLPVPVPAPGEVLVRVAACGICGSDVHGYDGSSGRRIPPLVMGHEAAGTIAALGSDVTNFQEGDRVTFDSTVSCGSCSFCVRGEVNLCNSRQVLGVSCGDYKRAGAFAEYIAVPSRIVYRLPESLAFAEAAMLEALAVAVHAVDITRVSPGSRALVVGAGTIGILLLQCLRAAGCCTVFIADVDNTRLVLARTLSASEVFLAGEDLAEKVRALTGGLGVDVVMEAVGKEETICLAVDTVRKGGKIGLVGNIAPHIALPLQKIVTRQIRLQGCCASAGEYPRAIELLASRAVQVKPLISAVRPLEEGPEWFARLHAREPNLLKVVLTPGASA